MRKITLIRWLEGFYVECTQSPSAAISRRWRLNFAWKQMTILFCRRRLLYYANETRTEKPARGRCPAE